MKKTAETAVLSEIGGEGGIRTPGRVAPTPPFQGGTFNHSDTSPKFCAFDGRTWCQERDSNPHVFKGQQILSLPRLPLRHPGIQLRPGAGEGNRTLVASLEGWSSAIELHPQFER